MANSGKTDRKQKVKEKPLAENKLKNNNQSWLRQPNESEKSYEYFSYFLSLPPADRSNRKVAEEYTVSEQNIKKIRRRWNWNERTLAYDNHLARASIRGAVKAAEKAEFDWATWETTNLEKTRKITDELYTKAEEILNLEVVESKTLEKQIFDTKTGKPVLDSEGNPVYQQVIIHSPLKFKLSDAARLTEAAIILTQYAVAKQRVLLVKVDFNDYMPKLLKSLDDMTEVELDEYIKEIRHTKEAILKGE